MKEIFFNGSSEFIGEMAMCLAMASYNYVLLKYVGVTGVAAYTIVGYVSYVYSMIVLGFGQGMVPIESFVYGAKEQILSVKVRRKTNQMVAGIAIVVYLVMSLAAGRYAQLFSGEQQVIDMAVAGLRIQMLSFLFMGFNTITSFYFTSLGRAKESAVISLARGIVILLICIYTLPTVLGVTGVWLVSMVTEVMTMLISIYYMKKERKNLCLKK